tara:strand:- start:199 stop:456 length:258 start_codon:yes stop_codon:yes gene_type:complete
VLEVQELLVLVGVVQMVAIQYSHLLQLLEVVLAHITMVSLLHQVALLAVVLTMAFLLKMERKVKVTKVVGVILMYLLAEVAVLVV